MTEWTRVQLPPHVGSRLEVYVNGVLQHEGSDYRREAGALVFSRRLAKEGRLGFWRWLSLLLGIAGTYRQNDSVDVIYEAGGRRYVVGDLALASIPANEGPPHPPTRSSADGDD